MMNEYRIKKITKVNEIYFQPQRKYLWWWFNLSYETTYYDFAIYHINEDIGNRQKYVIEYLDVTPEKLAPRTPNPPPEVL
jgi:hypothetical protein